MRTLLKKKKKKARTIQRQSESPRGFFFLTGESIFRLFLLSARERTPFLLKTGSRGTVRARSSTAASRCSPAPVRAPASAPRRETKKWEKEEKPALSAREYHATLCSVPRFHRAGRGYHAPGLARHLVAARISEF